MDKDDFQINFAAPGEEPEIPIPEWLDEVCDFSNVNEYSGETVPPEEILCDALDSIDVQNLVYVMLRYAYWRGVGVGVNVTCDKARQMYQKSVIMADIASYYELTQSIVAADSESLSDYLPEGMKHGGDSW